MHSIKTIEYSTRLYRAATAALIALILFAQVSGPSLAQDKIRRPQQAKPTQAAMGGLADTSVAINFERMGLKLLLALQNKSVGYGFAVFHNGQLIKHGSGGNARRSPDTTQGHEVPFEYESRVDIASCTKTITSIAVTCFLITAG